MINQNSQRDSNNNIKKQSSPNQLEWGGHNKELSDLNFIDRKPANDGKVDLSKEEPGRNRRGVKEGENSLSK
ncbi:MAG: hypothetical protein EOO87_03300 [Pedobacter sp.]|nr:MAG: hypothetical protein EOO87_03300 [Pedobacter sp.]